MQLVIANASHLQEGQRAHGATVSSFMNRSGALPELARRLGR
jgi:hypothetical protein